MQIEIKKMETDDEIRGKAYVHWKSWHETYPGLVSETYLKGLSLEAVEERAFLWRDNILVAKDGERVVGFIGFGEAGDALPETAEIFALYVLRAYCGQGVGTRLMDAALERLKQYPRICLWVLKENKRAIRFYETRGFRPDGEEKYVGKIEAAGIRMILTR